MLFYCVNLSFSSFRVTPFFVSSSRKPELGGEYLSSKPGDEWESFARDRYTPGENCKNDCLVIYRVCTLPLGTVYMQNIMMNIRCTSQCFKLSSQLKSRFFTITCPLVSLSITYFRLLLTPTSVPVTSSTTQM